MTKDIHYIDADELMAEGWYLTRTVNKPYRGAIETKILAVVPYADVKPVVRGEWVESGKSSLFPYDTIWACSVCDAKYFIRQRFCPNCGADMRGDRE